MEAKRPAVAILGDGLWEPIEWYLDYMKVERGASTHTIEAYRRDLIGAGLIAQESGCPDWRTIDQTVLAKIENSLGPPVARTTALRKISSLRSFVRFLKRRGYSIDAAIRFEANFKRPRRLPKSLAPTQTGSLLIAKDDSPSALRDLAMWELIYGAGLRVSELVSLDMGSVDFETKSVRVTGKRGKTRLIPLPDLTLSAVRQYLEQGRAILLKKSIPNPFVSETGKPLLRQTIYSRLAKQARAAGIATKIGPHTLRHTYAADLVRHGADLRSVQELLGHESIETTQIYTQLNLDAVRKQFLNAHPRE